jgi:hypothetical protein
MPVIYTAQYRYPGPDRLDITVKGKDPIGRAFAPTWDMVNGVKKGTLLKYEYEAIEVEKRTGVRPQSYEGIYYQMMNQSWAACRQAWTDVWNRPEVTFVCFCPADSFCHRYLLANLFVSMRAQYFGERTGF